MTTAAIVTVKKGMISYDKYRCCKNVNLWKHLSHKMWSKKIMSGNKRLIMVWFCPLVISYRFSMCNQVHKPHIINTLMKVSCSQILHFNISQQCWLLSTDHIYISWSSIFIDIMKIIFGNTLLLLHSYLTSLSIFSSSFLSSSSAFFLIIFFFFF